MQRPVLPYLIRSQHSPGALHSHSRAGSQLFSLHLSPFCLIQCHDLITGDGPASACGEAAVIGRAFSTVISGIAASVAASCSRPFASSHAIMRSASLCVDATGCCGAAAARIARACSTLMPCCPASIVASCSRPFASGMSGSPSLAGSPARRLPLQLIAA